MSTFFSNKYLKYRRMLERGEPPIEKDVPCANCGYNIRGLKPGKLCPECGVPIPFDFETAADPLLSGDHARRARTQWGLTLMCAAIVAFIIARLGFSTMWAIAKWPPPGPYLGAATVIATTWAVGVWMGTPASMDIRSRARTPLRWIGRLSQVLWIPAVAMPLAAHLSNAWRIYQDEIAMWSGLLSAGAALGWLVLAFVLHQVADDLEL
ncbi:MAG TPA: hypothetical protein VFX76_18890, partial [Roseiflexaceae bacterium]|nr:hypothetical protein [Roseiflexaceae bacterium]